MQDQDWMGLRKSGILVLHPTTNPAILPDALIGMRRVQFCEPLPAALLATLSQALSLHPDVTLRVYDRFYGRAEPRLEPDLRSLEGFERVRHLAVHLWTVESFAPIRKFQNLVSLDLGETHSHRPSVDVVESLPELRWLRVEGHARGLEAVVQARSLRHLSLRASRTRSYEWLTGHQSLESLWVLLGGVRDLRPLHTLSRLRHLSLCRVRLLDADDLALLASGMTLEALELEDLRNIYSLKPLGITNARWVRLAGLSGLDTFAPLGAWSNLELLELVRSRPADRLLSPLLACLRLKELTIGDAYSQAEMSAFAAAYGGDVLWYRGNYLKGSSGATGLFWDNLARRGVDIPGNR